MSSISYCVRVVVDASIFGAGEYGTIAKEEYVVVV